MKRRNNNPTIAYANVYNNVDGDRVSRMTITPSSFVEKGRNKIIRQVDVKTPKEIILQIEENTTELENDEIIRIAKKILKSGRDMIVATNNETNIDYCKKAILSLPKDSYTYYSILRNELAKYLGAGIKDRAISIALKELVEDKFLEEIEFYTHDRKKVKGYKVIGVEEF
jgi:hypothetical protein